MLKAEGVSTAKIVLFHQGSTELRRCENCIFFLPVNILTGVTRRLLGPHDTLPCVLIYFCMRSAINTKKCIFKIFKIRLECLLVDNYNAKMVCFKKGPWSYICMHENCVFFIPVTMVHQLPWPHNTTTVCADVNVFLLKILNGMV